MPSGPRASAVRAARQANTQTFTHRKIPGPQAAKQMPSGTARQRIRGRAAGETTDRYTQTDAPARQRWRTIEAAAPSA